MSVAGSLLALSPHGRLFIDNDIEHAAPRPRQIAGVKGLWTLQHLGLAACLADEASNAELLQFVSLDLKMATGE